MVLKLKQKVYNLCHKPYNIYEYNKIKNTVEQPDDDDNDVFEK